MKKLILIVLLAFMCMSVINVAVVAKVKFGNWDKWDEQLPPAENKSWYWAVFGNEPRILGLKGFGDSGSDVIVLISDLYFYGTKDGKTKASAIFYSQSGNMDLKDWGIPNADLAFVAFPPKKGKIIIRAYKMEDKIFRFFEQWEILFKDQEIVVSQDRKFRGIFEEWIEKQVAPGKTVPEDLIEMLLPELVTWEKKFFVITDGYKWTKK